jgi:hypothetical protein
MPFRQLHSCAPRRIHRSSKGSWHRVAPQWRLIPSLVFGGGCVPVGASHDEDYVLVAANHIRLEAIDPEAEVITDHSRRSSTPPVYPAVCGGGTSPGMRVVVRPGIPPVPDAIMAANTGCAGLTSPHRVDSRSPSQTQLATMPVVFTGLVNFAAITPFKPKL